MELFKKANGEIVHRGPDDEGYFHDQHMSMAFRRLSIIDKENGHQPYSYANGRYMITFNGEIYNHIELRETLKSFGITCETSSDTEVLVALYAAIGKMESFLHQKKNPFCYLFITYKLTKIPYSTI
jgi:asparagine synthase (glutamine-hydrolysing)